MEGEDLGETGRKKGERGNSIGYVLNKMNKSKMAILNSEKHRKIFRLRYVLKG